MDFKIVYVFGPATSEEKYFNDETLTLQNGEWVKIGETTFTADGIDKINRNAMKDYAIKRVRQESRTGIPVAAKIYDVFIFPHKNKNIDKIIRQRLCAELYSLENSAENNKQIDDKETIKAGEEFVYGATRSQIKYAVQSYDHDLIVNSDEKEIKLLAQICRCNDIDINTNDEEEQEQILVKRRPKLDLDTILELGAEIVLTKSDGKPFTDVNKEPVKATYIGGNKINCRGEIKCTTPLARKYLNQKVSGNEYWRYEGEKLSSLRKD